jgi:hypothetical protein
VREEREDAGRVEGDESRDVGGDGVDRSQWRIEPS